MSLPTSSLMSHLFSLSAQGACQNIDALDAVQELLDVAKSKGVYKKHICEIIEDGKAIRHIEESK